MPVRLSLFKKIRIFGVIAAITRKLSWNGINIIEIISTLNELNFVISSRDAMKGYKALQEMVMG